MKLCIVNRNTGWPVADPRNPFDSVIELQDGDAADGLASGYLILASPADPLFTPRHAALAEAFRKPPPRTPASTLALPIDTSDEGKE